MCEKQRERSDGSWIKGLALLASVVPLAKVEVMKKFFPQVRLARTREGLIFASLCCVGHGSCPQIFETYSNYLYHFCCRGTVLAVLFLPCFHLWYVKGVLGILATVSG